MLKSNYIKSLPVVLLISLMVGCERPPLDSQNSNPTVKISTSPIVQEKPDNLNAVLSAYSEFKNSITKLNSELKNFVVGNLQPDQVNFSEPNKKLIKLQESILALKIQLNGISNNSDINQSIDDINTTITDIQRVIKPIEKGLNSAVVREVQQLIDLQKNTGIAPTGIFKTTTQEQLEKFLVLRLGNLDQQFKEIDNLIQKTENISINNNIINPDSPIIANSTAENQDEILISKSALDNIYNRLNLTVTITSCGFIILAGLFAWLMYRLNLVETRLKSSNSSKNETQLGNIKNYIESEFTQIEQYLQSLDTRFKNLEISSQNYSSPNYKGENNQSYTSQSNTATNHPQPKVVNISHSQSSTSNKETQIVTLYNNQPRSLSANAITVAETDHTVEQRRMGRTVAPILEENQLGNYWIIQEGHNEYLVPKGSIKINEYNYETISSCFECLAYNPNYSSNFILLKLAIVSSIGQNWQLIEPGELQF